MGRPERVIPTEQHPLDVIVYQLHERLDLIERQMQDIREFLRNLKGGKS